MSFAQSYYPNYFSINDILATEERIQCKVELNLPRLGFLDITSEAPDLKPGTKLEFPFWLASSLHSRRRPIVSVEIPKYYKEGWRDIVDAGPCAVKLSQWNLHYYELGMLITQFNSRESEKIKDNLLLAFKIRLRSLMDSTENPYAKPTLDTPLPMLEHNLLLAGRKARTVLIEWLKQGSGNIEKSEMVANLMKKRKRNEFEAD
ncbi:DNA replication complex GINS protein PSF3 [Microplitis mediator]|uniref:DNA replication complex GINS protein PSF3 n=1 Tax=Microplitis mediator TaxID=375433 RepID=UPI0025548148|nr:DNA replication complex GINS protein PSF3 [Microplitis mediator]XP_057341412.1 DNA replication complex GINS protein PSF3 [Microplitis mediator]